MRQQTLLGHLVQIPASLAPAAPQSQSQSQTRLGACAMLVLVLPLPALREGGGKNVTDGGNPKLGQGHVLEAGGECWLPDPGAFGCVLPAWKERGTSPSWAAGLDAVNTGAQGRAVPIWSCFCLWAAEEANVGGRLQGYGCLREGDCLCEGGGAPHRASAMGRARGREVVLSLRSILLPGSPPSLIFSAVDPGYLIQRDEPQIFPHSLGSSLLSAPWLLSVCCYHAFLYLTQHFCLWQRAFSEVKLNTWQNLQKRSPENIIALSWLPVLLFK